MCLLVGREQVRKGKGETRRGEEEGEGGGSRIAWMSHRVTNGICRYGPLRDDDMANDHSALVCWHTERRRREGRRAALKIGAGGKEGWRDGVEAGKRGRKCVEEGGRRGEVAGKGARNSLS